MRRGRACLHPALTRRLGPTLRTLTGVAPGDSAIAARRKIAAWVDLMLHDDDIQLGLAVTAALALHRAADHRDLAARERWLADELNVHERTARRRVRDAFEILVERCAESADESSARQDRDLWHITLLRAVMRIEFGCTELTEHRTVRCHGTASGTLVTKFSLPRPNGARSHELLADVLYGGRVRAIDRASPEHWVYTIELPRTFAPGETHTYGMRFRIPAGQRMAPHYVVQPLRPCEKLDLIIRFDPERMPDAVYRVDGLPPRMVDSSPGRDALAEVNRLGEVYAEFNDLHQGLAYGVRWSYSH